MPSHLTRREFLVGGCLLASTSAIPAAAASLSTVLAPQPLYPAMDLSYFDTPITAAPADIRIGYAAITWDGNDRQAIDDISSLGFRGIQLRSNAITEFRSAAELRALLAKHNLTMVALSSGGVSIDPANDKQEIEKHVSHARFVRDVGGLYLQVTDNRPKGRELTADDYRHLGTLLNAIGKESADLGIPLGYHNHMGSMGQTPEGVERVMNASDPRYVKLELDIAHYYQGGGDPAKAVEQYRQRLLFLHIKDVEQEAPTATNPHPYYFVELGRGKVDIPAVFAALHKIDFRGWAVVELDDTKDKSRSPKESAEINKKYLEDKLGIAV